MIFAAAELMAALNVVPFFVWIIGADAGVTDLHGLPLGVSQISV